ncbi:hypothetical protein X953_10945 [Virgibacillus sp. SK37]|nr:sporulation protein YpjB [Virgibacillus sp. SK37]AIF45448.1 hypothetical protein X953_10945 [Virgibacillus sp. SK37]
MAGCKRITLLWLTLISIGIFFSFYFFPLHVKAGTQLGTTVVDTQSNGLGFLIWTVIIVGGCIGITLSYVSWRKYKGEKNKKVQKDDLVD